MSASLFVLLAAAGMAGTEAPGAAAARPAAEQTASEQPEQIVVRGRCLADFRLEVEQLRVRAYDVFNEINSDEDLDVGCRDDGRTGRRVRERVCRSRFEQRISSAAA